MQRVIQLLYVIVKLGGSLGNNGRCMSDSFGGIIARASFTLSRADKRTDYYHEKRIKTHPHTHTNTLGIIYINTTKLPFWSTGHLPPTRSTQVYFNP